MFLMSQLLVDPDFFPARGTPYTWLKHKQTKCNYFHMSEYIHLHRHYFVSMASYLNLYVNVMYSLQR